MNYFEFYGGDYLRDTSALSLAEHGAYLLLMCHYYGSEQPLPSDFLTLYRISHAIVKAEQAAVRGVADRFFPVGDDGLRRNGRADGEIAKARRRIETAQANGAKGGRPLRNPSETQQEPVRNPTGTRLVSSGFEKQGVYRTQKKPKRNPSETHSGEALHTPHAIKTSEPEARGQGATSASAAGRACLLMRQAGCNQTNPSHSGLLAALAEGVSPEALADTVREALEARRSKPFAWAIATARNRHAEGVPPLSHGSPVAASALSKNARAFLRLEALKSHGNAEESPASDPLRELSAAVPLL
ncbi:MAG: YdaU family protein, partial [Candidatus Dormibacteria bacterium]